MSEHMDEQPKKKTAGFDWKWLLQVVKEVMLHPISFWNSAAAESRSVKQLYIEDLAILAAVGPVCQYIKMITYGEPVLFLTMRWEFTSGLGKTVVAYGIVILSVFVLSTVLEKLAPKFGATVTKENATKAVVYSALPGLAAGVLNILQGFNPIPAFVGCYGLYLLWNALPVLTTVSNEKRSQYYGASVGISFLVTAALVFILRMFV